jgi:hypothetical protein
VVAERRLLAQIHVQHEKHADDHDPHRRIHQAAGRNGLQRRNDQVLLPLLQLRKQLDLAERRRRHDPQREPPGDAASVYVGFKENPPEGKNYNASATYSDQVTLSFQVPSAETPIVAHPCE